MKDSRGVEVKAGDTVIYAVRFSSSMWLRNGVVQSVDGDKATVKVELDSWEKKSRDEGWSKPREMRKVSGVNMFVVKGLPDADSDQA